MEIMQPGFELYVRSLLGVDDVELPDDELNSPIYEELAEAQMKARVPGYATITNEVDLLYLRNATMYLVCALVCPSMDRRLNTEESTLDVKWKKGKIDWKDKENKFLSYVENMLSLITSTEVASISYSATIATSTGNTRDPIGGLQS